MLRRCSTSVLIVLYFPPAYLHLLCCLADNTSSSAFTIQHAATHIYLLFTPSQSHTAGFAHPVTALSASIYILPYHHRHETRGLDNLQFNISAGETLKFFEIMELRFTLTLNFSNVKQYVSES